MKNLSEEDKLCQLIALHAHRCNILGLPLKGENEGTPERCAKADLDQFREIPLKFTTFENKGYDQLILKENIPFSAMCSHHLYPYFGHCHIGYIPGKKVCGLSKLARMIQSFSQGAASQEWLTQEITNFLEKELEPAGVIVVMKARHTCESTRGVKNDHEESHFTTSAVTGVFAKSETGARSEFFNLIK
ncbi:MAG: GTP cyclohydrolase I [Deltaproteobacteria bacterium]|nr:GTP cyclohydrolase I [Deltaproteobacteria bacterium]